MKRKELEWAHYTFGNDIRVPLGIDSLVTCGVSNKGRSASKALNREYRRGIGVEVAAGVRGASHFAPTRLNPADGPSRDAEVPAPVAAPPPWASGSCAADGDLMDRAGIGCCLREHSGWAELVSRALLRDAGGRPLRQNASLFVRRVALFHQ